jgi:ABC-type nitrate/sulfonate/bicarbonate transport system substrate-binding protein
MTFKEVGFMSEYTPIELAGFYRSPSHLPIWEVMDKAGIWSQVGVESLKFEYRANPTDAEAALFDGSVDFVSGNHITPYALVARGKPIVCLASPHNAVQDSVASREPVSSLVDLRGKRIADLSMEGRAAGFNHLRGNHMLYLIKAGVGIDEVTWVELADDVTPEYRRAVFDAMAEGAADATFLTGGAEEYRRAGFHILELPPLPMISGPTITTTLTALRRKDHLGERLVKGMVLGVHYARTHREDTERILAGLKERVPEVGNARYESVARLPLKPYPDPEAVMNARELCLLKDKDALKISPLALWDTHYLRELDDSGFIDALSQN